MENNRSESLRQKSNILYNRIMRFLKMHRHLTLFLIGMFLFLVLYMQMHKENFMDLGYTIAVSSIAAFVFYIFQVYEPGQRRKQIIKNEFKQQYSQFKESCIKIFLSASKNSNKSGLSKELCDIKRFSEYFEE